ncbi:MAG: hypothetical protein WAX89_08025 [Alphaproteobacteria bacterium]
MPPTQPTRIAITPQTAHPDATKTYADTCWRANPHISPDSWREWEGFTVGKVALLVTPATAPFLRQAWEDGINLWLVLPSAIRAVAEVLRDTAIKPILVGIWPWQTNTLAPDFSPLPLTALLPVLPETPLAPEALLPLLEHLENQVKQGKIGCYGLAAEGLIHPATSPTFLNIRTIMEHARTATHTIWQRHKRPALRLLAVPCNVLETAAVQEHNTLLTDDTLASVVDYAVQAHLGVLALRPLTAHTPQGMALLTDATAAGQHLKTLLTPHLPTPWQDKPLASIALNAAASWPGITAAVLDMPLLDAIPPVYTGGDFADMATLIG